MAESLGQGIGVLVIRIQGIDSFLLNEILVHAAAWHFEVYHCFNRMAGTHNSRVSQRHRLLSLNIQTGKRKSIVIVLSPIPFLPSFHLPDSQCGAWVADGKLQAGCPWSTFSVPQNTSIISILEFPSLSVWAWVRVVETMCGQALMCTYSLMVKSVCSEHVFIIWVKDTSSFKLLKVVEHISSR